MKDVSLKDLPGSDPLSLARAVDSRCVVEYISKYANTGQQRYCG
jgi:hypothetical protein